MHAPQQMLTGEQIPYTGDLLKMKNVSNSAGIERQKTRLSILGNVFTQPANLIGAICRRCIAYTLLVILSTRKPRGKKQLSLRFHINSFEGMLRYA